MNDLNNSFEKMKALVVDDEPTNRLILKKLLELLNYIIVEADNGKKAIEVFNSESPDIVFMDVMMPLMNGYEATKEIKQQCEDDFVPVIFLTALTGTEDMQKCVDAGGDDFLSKPINLVTLKSKIHAMERIRKLYRHLRVLNQKLQADDLFAKNIFTEAILKKNENIPAIKTWFEKSDRFNNDLLLTSYTPTSGLNILFGHFNVEGTAAAVGALPTSETFSAMTAKGYSPHDIIDAINNKLHQMLPSEIELQVIFLNFNNEVNLLSYANFGMPEAYIVSDSSQSIVRTLKPSDIRLGKEKHFLSEQYFTNLAINNDERIILSRNIYLDYGESSSEELMSETAFQQEIINAAKEESLFDALKNNIVSQLDHTHNNKNVSLIDIQCTETLTPDAVVLESNSERNLNAETAEISYEDLINFELTIQNKQLRHLDPIPTLINFMDSISNIEKSHDALFTIFTEFYVNALDHGILGLDSSLKSSPEGFFNYFKEKENRIKRLEKGSININLCYMHNDETDQLEIRFTDSGPGFDFQKVLDSSFQPENEYSGRGFLLLRNLCDKLEFMEPGNSVRAVYSWHHKLN